MQDTSFFRLFVSALVKGFSKTFGVLLGILFFWIALTVISSQEKLPRATSTAIAPNHTWKTAPLATDKPTILRMSINGGIGIREGRECVSAEDVQKVLCDIPQLELKSGAIKGILISMNSPGGDATDAETIRTLLLEAKERFKIPCIVYVNGMCASGGVMIATAADKIISSPFGLIGSVGVIMPTRFNVAKPMEQWGIVAKTIHAGKCKDELNPFRPWDADEGQYLQEDLNKYYERFISLVCQARPRISPDFLRNEGAKVWLPEEAKEIGFIDEIEPSYFRCLEKFASSLGIEENYQVIELIPQVSFSDLFTVGAQALMKPSIEHKVTLPGEEDGKTKGKPLYLYHPN